MDTCQEQPQPRLMLTFRLQEEIVLPCWGEDNFASGGGVIGRWRKCASFSTHSRLCNGVRWSEDLIYETHRDDPHAEVTRALEQAGFTVTRDRHYLRAFSGLCLWDGTGVEAWVSRTETGWRVSDLDQAYFMAVSTCMPAESSQWEGLAWGYHLTCDRGYWRDVEDGPDLARRLVGVARDVVAFQIAVHGYALAMRDTHGWT